MADVIGVIANPLAKTLGFVSGAAGLLLGSLTSVVASFGATIGSLVDFGAELIQGEGSLSGFYKALESLPGPLGMIASLFSKIAALQEQELGAYRVMTQAGINFGGQLSTLRSQALQLGMTLDQYSEFVKNNSSVIATLGKTADEGAEVFQQLATTLRNSETGNLLRALGIDAQQTSQGLLNYIEATGGRTASEMKSASAQKALVASAGEYMLQLDALATITGKSKEEQEKLMKEANANAAYEAYLLTLDEEGKKKAAIAMQNALATGGKAGADLLKSQLLGLPPMTDAARKLEALGPNVAAGIKDMGSAVQNVRAGVDDVNRGYAKAQAGATQDINRLGNSVKALSFGTDGTSTAIMGLQAQANRNTQQGIKSQADAEARLKDVTKSQEDRLASGAAAAAETEKAFKDIGYAIWDALKPAIEFITPKINELATAFLGFIQENMPAIKAALQQVVDAVSEFAKNLMSPEGRDKIINDLKYYFGLIMIEVKKAVTPDLFYDEEDVAKDKARLEAEKKAYDDRLAAYKANDTARLKESTAKINEIKEKQAIENNKPISGSEGAMAGAASLGAAGLLAGSVIPGVGNAVGAAIGTLVGAIAGGLGLIDYGLVDNKPPGRDTGSLGKTGKLFENFGSGTPVTLHGIESVSTPEQIGEIVSNAVSASQAASADSMSNKLDDQLNRLNTLTAELLKYMKETTEYAKRNVDATKALNRNLF